MSGLGLKLNVRIKELERYTGGGGRAGCENPRVRERESARMGESQTEKLKDIMPINERVSESGTMCVCVCG
jgi:hypothetical protein